MTSDDEGQQSAPAKDAHEFKDIAEASTPASARGRKGAEGRWLAKGPTRHSIDEGVLDFAGMQFRCAVLDDETRVVSGTEFMRVMGIYRSGALSTRRSGEEAFHIPLHLAHKNLLPFILDDAELVAALKEPVRYRDASGSLGDGIPAHVLRRICSVWVRADAAGILGPTQQKIAENARILINALADVALVALIDEATGYQKRRAHDALQTILRAYIAPELLPWQARFPVTFYEQLYKVMGWRYDASSTARTAYVGKLTNRLIYEQLPPGVHEELKRRNPTIEGKGRRRHKHHQFLTGETGHPHLQNQILSVTTLLRATPPGQWKLFETLFNQAFPPRQQDLFADEEVVRLTADAHD